MSSIANDDLKSPASAALCRSTRSDKSVAVILATLLALTLSSLLPSLFLACFPDLDMFSLAVLVLLAVKTQIVDVVEGKIGF